MRMRNNTLEFLKSKYGKLQFWITTSQYVTITVPNASHFSWINIQQLQYLTPLFDGFVEVLSEYLGEDEKVKARIVEYIIVTFLLCIIYIYWRLVITCQIIERLSYPAAMT